MWISRTPEQTLKWHISTKRDARFQGAIYAGGCWLGIAVLLAGGCMAGANTGLIAQDGLAGGTFWSRLPFFALPGIPIAIWIYFREIKKAMERAKYMTICPKCETAAESNEGQACECGGTFVAQSSVRWVEDKAKN